MNQTYGHVNLMLERAFPNVHGGFPWWHNDTPAGMEHYLLHTAGASLLTSSGGPVCDGRKILSEGSRFEVFDGGDMQDDLQNGFGRTDVKIRRNKGRKGAHV